MRNKKRVLFIASFPPPVHGSAMMSQFIKKSKVINESFDCDYINLSTSHKMNEIGIFNLIKIWRLFFALLVLLWKLMTKQYDLCYLAITCHGLGFIKDAPFVLLCKLFGKKVIIHQHNKGMSSDIDRWPYRWLLPLCYKDVNVILLSWSLYHDIERIVPKEKVLVCPNGIPEVKYNYQMRHNDIPHLLFLSNLIESKGVLVLLDALQRLKEKGYSTVCDFVGGETKEISVHRFVDEVNRRGLERFVVFHGPKYGHEKHLFLENADIFLFPTYYYNECFPLVLLEAMQFGLPVISTDEGGIVDVIQNEKNGLICKKNDPSSLANCIECMLIDETLRVSYGMKGREYYMKYYSLHSFELKMKDILDSCLNESI